MRGAPLDCPPPLTSEEKAEVARLIALAEDERRPAGKAQREIWKEQHVGKMRAAGASEETIERTIESWSKGVLLPDAVLEFTNPEIGFVTVRQILEDPAKYDNEKCHHPIEGREYKAQGKFFAESRQIYSFGHGGQTFKLKWSETADPRDFDMSWADVDEFTRETSTSGSEGPKTDAPKYGTSSEEIYAAFLAELATIAKAGIPDWIVSRLLATNLSPALEDEILTEAGKHFGGKRAIVKMLKKARANARKAGDHSQPHADGISENDFYAYMPAHQYIYIPTRELWPASSVNARLGEDMNMWVDENRHVEQMTWAPGRDMVIQNALIDDGGWIDKHGVSCFNLYRPPVILPGDATQAGKWLELVHLVYPDNAEHIIQWCAHRVQFPGVKINHALVLGGEPGIGKDSILEPVKRAVGDWNFAEVDANQVMGRFNGYLKSVVLRISEVKDLGEVSRYEFYNHMKNLTAAPPNALRVDEKNLREHYVLNVTCIIYTTNHRTDSLYLPANDRRHYCTWSKLTQDDFTKAYFDDLYAWYEREGFGHVGGYLRALDLSGFNSKAPPLKTPAFWDLVDAGRAPEDGELADLIDLLGNPPAFTLGDLMERAGGTAIRDWLDERKNRRQIPHRLEGCGYTAIRNDCATDGLWKIKGSRQTVYAAKELSNHERLNAASELSQVKQKANPFEDIFKRSSKSNNAFKMGASQ
jgi:hypothetical protein